MTKNFVWTGWSESGSELRGKLLRKKLKYAKGINCGKCTTT
jgi:hypothetical protein